jgi:hypothetical protein
MVECRAPRHRHVAARGSARCRRRRLSLRSMTSPNDHSAPQLDAHRALLVTAKPAQARRAIKELILQADGQALELAARLEGVAEFESESL